MTQFFNFLYMTHNMCHILCRYYIKKFFGAMLYAYMEFSLLVAQNAHENASKKMMVFRVNWWYYYRDMSCFLSNSLLAGLINFVA